MTGELYGGIDNLEVLADATRYNRFLANTVVKAGKECTTAVDFGAGTGLLAAAIRERGLGVACVEPDPRLQRILADQGFEVYADLEAVADESQDFIYSLNVLEHIEDDQEAIAALFSKLKPGGRLFLYVPAFDLLFSSMDRKIGHYRRYRRGGLVTIARRAGFSIEYTAYADSLGFFATLLYKFIGSRRGDISPASVRLYDRFVFPLSRSLDRLGLSRLFGKNLMVLVRREFTARPVPESRPSGC